MRDNKHVILVIDDNVDQCKAMKVILEGNGYIMEEAHTAEEGLKVYKEVSPDLLIVDLMMEEIDAGTNLVKELKLLNNEAPVFLASAAGDKMAENTDYSQLGFSGVFQKPIETDRLLNVLKSKLS